MPSNPPPNTRTYMSPKPEPKQQSAPKRLPSAKVFSRKHAPWLLVVCLAIFSLFMVVQYQQAQDTLSGKSNASSQDEQQLRKLILLPSNEKPTIAAIKYAEKLKSQTFFKDARDGDKVFVYNKARKAVLYRPSSNMIINVQPVSSTPKT